MCLIECSVCNRCQMFCTGSRNIYLNKNPYFSAWCQDCVFQEAVGSVANAIIKRYYVVSPIPYMVTTRKIERSIM